MDKKYNSIRWGDILFLFAIAVCVVGMFCFLISELKEKTEKDRSCSNKCSVYKYLTTADTCFCMTQQGWKEAK